ncbi:MAG TPA: acyl-CoA thioesterase [Anaeromyxobacteraceae bacterium]|nr:acyl-CoA thioesterase [Anaeromyxobacteraceae bacterium]
MTPVPAGASRVETTHLVMPGHANVHGTAFGGTVMQWTDLAASMAAMRHARLPVVTASVDQLSFLAPVRIGQIAILRAQVNAVFATSMEVGVEVLTEDPRTGEHHHCCDAYLTFVALGVDGRPVPVPPLATETEADRRREREARTRREARLALREALRGR